MATSSEDPIVSLEAALLSLKNKAEFEKFLADLLTEHELTEFRNRWQAAQQLDQGVSYKVIEEETGLSSTTVARVSKWLNSVGAGGYRIAIDRAKKK